VEFYVPLGPRGFLLRVGTFLIGVFGGMVYRQAARRRALLPTNPHLTLGLAEFVPAD
jgi:hypothetical protein